jgi:hypothetical protein
MEIWQLYKEYTASWVRGLVRTRGVVVEDIDAVIDALEHVREGVELLSTSSRRWADLEEWPQTELAPRLLATIEVKATA